MTDAERLAMRRAADAIWEEAKQCKDLALSNQLKKIATDMHYRASKDESNSDLDAVT